jgi:hypothetical protein
LTISLDNFKGLVVGVDKVDQAPDTTPDCQNIRMDTIEGSFDSNVGFTKINQTNHGGVIVSLHRLPFDTFANNILISSDAKLLKDTT